MELNELEVLFQRINNKLNAIEINKSHENHLEPVDNLNEKCNEFVNDIREIYIQKVSKSQIECLD